MKRVAAIVAVALALSAGATVGAAPTPGARTVPCHEAIARVASGRAGGYRVVLGVVSAPRAYIPQVVEWGMGRWRYRSKAGLVIRGGSSPVTVTVPRAWRSRLAITWGNRPGIFSEIRFRSCAAGPKPWNAYAGGFRLSSPSACVPLVFRVGRRSATVRFGLGRTC